MGQVLDCLARIKAREVIVIELVSVLTSQLHDVLHSSAVVGVSYELIHVRWKLVDRILIRFVLVGIEELLRKSRSSKATCDVNRLAVLVAVLQVYLIGSRHLSTSTL